MPEPYHVTPEHYHAIGTLIAMWSSFEAQMALGIIALSGMTKQAGIIATVISSITRIWVRALSECL